MHLITLEKPQAPLSVFEPMIQQADHFGPQPSASDLTEHKGSAIQLVADLKLENSAAAQSAWSVFQVRMERFGRKLLNQNLCRFFDEKDLASEVFQKFIESVQLGRCDKMSKMRELWSYIATIMINHARNRCAAATCQKRGGGLIRGESIFLSDTSEALSFDKFPSQGMQWEITGLHDEYTEHFMSALPNDDLRRITELKLSGYENAEIAKLFSTSTRSIERKLVIIRRCWKATEDLL